MYTYLNGDLSEDGVLLDLNDGCLVKHKLLNIEGRLLHSYRKLNKCVVIDKEFKRHETFLSSLERVNNKAFSINRVGTWVYKDFKSLPEHLNIQAGDLVITAGGIVGIMGPCYRKYNICFLETEKGLVQTRVTELSLVVN